MRSEITKLAKGLSGSIAQLLNLADINLVREVRLPAGLSYEEATAAPMAAVTALQGLRDRRQIREGERMLVNGASGGVGTFAVQLAKTYGAEVTGVCRTEKMDAVRSIGADEVLDYTEVDYTTTGDRYDLIFDAGAHQSVFASRRALAPGDGTSWSAVCLDRRCRRWRWDRCSRGSVTRT